MSQLTFHGVINCQGELLESLHSREDLQVHRSAAALSSRWQAQLSWPSLTIAEHNYHQTPLDVAADGPVPPDFTVFYSFPDAPRLEA